jgi:hypothetical protein
MQLLSEDPTYLAGGLGVLAVLFLLALKVTQQGKYLFWALAALGMAGLVVLVEWLWVTDNERIEQTVYGLGRAVAASDVPGTLSFLADDVRYTTRGGSSFPSQKTRELIEDLVGSARFDFLRVNKLVANAGAQSRRGTAEFRVLAGGSIQRGGFNTNFGSTNSAWSLGLAEKNGVWKVNRITPISLPQGENVLPK